MVSRRNFMTGLGAGSAALATGVAEAAPPDPFAMKPLVGQGYVPEDDDEKGMWALMERAEEEISGSNIVIEDEGLNTYLKDIIASVGGPAAKDFRIYLARVPEFNAMMFPTGFSVVFSGLLLRMKNEAQLAGVIAHEAAHFLCKHQIRGYRDRKRKTDIFTVLAMGAGVAGGAAGVYVGDLVRYAQFGTLLSLLSYSRGMEAESDSMGLRLMAEAGYEPSAASQTWQQLLAELDKSAMYRGKSRSRRFSLFSTHPSPKSRMKDLAYLAERVRQPGASYNLHADRYVETLGDWRRIFLEDQILLNDPGASQHIVETLAEDGWNGLLRYAEADIWRLRGEPGDRDRAAAGYATAVLYDDAPPDAWRWHGLMLHRAGKRAEARDALAHYLVMAPEATDAAFIKQMIADIDRQEISL
ncbi:M48 family metallopeptidase [Sphingomicrobium clamense]|uniref:M48 family metalloprotease n=1 Tax=Sphingomicrobium clamense TaxID=2851013 RepID=A0ABS6V6V1_9SPHN|nr:M48 family metallopeptidase [Sphingomicrobium sp. B8]MBW0145254.1 M48 family metalloprotease [Sphingomicrobium sp. B8]